MRIRDKLTFQFSAIVGLIVIIFSISIFYFSKQYRNNAFNLRLREKALNTANLNEIGIDLLKKLRRDYLQQLPSEFVRIYNIDDKLIFKDDSLSFIPPAAYLKKVREKGEYDYEENGRQFVGILYKKDYIIIASAINVNGAEELNYLKYILISGNLICLLLLIIAGRFFARQALKPISGMIKEVENIGESNLNERLNEGKKKDEIAQLAITFNKLFNRIESAFERQKRFVANASHEFRTPLTAITGEIEVALMKERNSSQYIEVLNSVLEEAKTMTNLSNNLLKLTQIRNSTELLVEKMNLIDLLQTIAEENHKRNPGTVLKFEFDSIDKLEEKFIEGNNELLKIAFGNIIENAYKFSDFKPVLIRTTQSGTFINFKIIDNGIGMTEEDIAFIFQPFYRSEHVSSINGSGIGLALTSKIIKLHGGNISVKSKLKTGTRITVILPLV